MGLRMETGQGNLSETTVEQESSESSKLVPVAESIRYRKRAQSAEKKVEILSEQLAEAESQAAKMSEQLSGIRLEQELTQRLSAAGSIDLETALLIGKAKLKGSDGSDLDACVEQLKREKPYLFTKERAVVRTAQKTAGAKERTTGGQTILEKAAKKAATTGNRADLQEYLKLRRNFV